MCLSSRFISWIGRFIPQIILRLVVAWHAWDFGIVHYHSATQSSAIQKIVPLNYLPSDLSFGLLIWWPIIGAIFLIFGFRVRLVTFGLLLISISSLTVNMPSDIGSLTILWHSVVPEILVFKSEILMTLMLLILLFLGAGWLSIDGLTRWTSCGVYARKSRKQNKINRKLVRIQKSELKKQKIAENVAQRKQKKLDKKQSKKVAKKQQKLQKKLDKKQSIKPLDNDTEKADEPSVAPSPVANPPKILKRSRIKIKQDIDEMRDVDSEANRPTAS